MEWGTFVHRELEGELTDIPVTTFFIDFSCSKIMHAIMLRKLQCGEESPGDFVEMQTLNSVGLGW